VITWRPSPDDPGGELDVDRYALYKRHADSTDWGDPLRSVPRGADVEEYIALDDAIEPGRWLYGVSALDCSPRRSPMVVTAPLEILP